VQRLGRSDAVCCRCMLPIHLSLLIHSGYPYPN
jgi:hypothetical protein